MSRMFRDGGAPLAVDSNSNRLRRLMGAKALNMSRAVKGPEKRKITVPVALPAPRSMVKVEPFQTLA